jgi:hypothetical protein
MGAMATHALATGDEADAQPGLVLDPATLAVSVRPGDGHTSLAFDVVQAAVEAVARGQVATAGQTGPTVAARFYAIAATTLYEAWQLFDPARTSLDGEDCRLERPLRKLERRMRRLTGRLPQAEREQFMENVMAAASVQVLSALAPEAAPLFAAATADHVLPLGKRLDAKAALLAHQLARRVLGFHGSDGATTGAGGAATPPYTPVNIDPEHVVAIDRWTPEYRQDDDPTSGLQDCLTPAWGQVRAFLASDQLDGFIATLKRPEPFLLQEGATADLRAGTITTAGGGVVPITPEAVGELINPAFIAQAERVIAASAALTEEQKFIAEFWEDGAGTAFPPGTWMTFGLYGAEKENLALGEEVKLYFTLGNALQAAAVATWRLKIATDVARPVRVIRHLSDLGLVGEPDPITGLHSFEAYSRDTYQTETINGMAWETYQQPNGAYSPPFPEYVSGHSTFSAAAGTVLQNVLGADFGASVSGQGVFEPNHQRDVVTLRWNTWQEAYEQAGLSRIYGGIHFDDGNQQGLALGALIGEATFQAASQLWA